MHIHRPSSRPLAALFLGFVALLFVGVAASQADDRAGVPLDGAPEVIIEPTAVPTATPNATTPPAAPEPELPEPASTDIAGTAMEWDGASSEVPGQTVMQHPLTHWSGPLVTNVSDDPYHNVLIPTSVQARDSEGGFSPPAGPTPTPTATPTPTPAPYDPWYPVRMCESTNNYSINTGNSFYGAYQFTIGTWNWVAEIIERDDLLGVRPDLAAPADQDRMADALAFEVAGGGLHHWPVCGRLYGT